MIFTELSAFLCGVLIISFFSKTKIKKIMNIGIFIIWLMILPPILDVFVFDTSPDLVYERNKLLDPETLSEILTFGVPANYSPGISTIGIILILSTFLYLFVKTRTTLKTVLGTMIFYILCLFFAGQADDQIEILQSQQIPVVRGGENTLLLGGHVADRRGVDIRHPHDAGGDFLELVSRQNTQQALAAIASSHDGNVHNTAFFHFS